MLWDVTWREDMSSGGGRDVSLGFVLFPRSTSVFMPLFVVFPVLDWSPFSLLVPYRVLLIILV